jgi:aspartyl-tRNA(Asn)/glutamyl-tRNA(Gln) amidotransferase subunit A
MAQDLAYRSAAELLRLIRTKQASPVEIMEQCLARIDQFEPKLNCFVTRTSEQAIDAARRAEQAVMRREPLGSLHGLPVSIKDLIAVAGVRQTFGSRTAKNNIAELDAPSVARLTAAGACIVGKTATSEFGCKAAGDSPLTGITRNPWNLGRTPGGSSCGAAASVAAGMTPVALGTDGGGSIRTPSAFTGLFGIKGQFARVPVFPTSATPTLAHVGPLARAVRDAALVLAAISGHDRCDPFSLAEPVPDFVGACERPIEGMRIAWSPTLGYAKPAREIVEIAEKAVRVFETLGCHVEHVDKVVEEDPADMWVAEFYAGIGTRLQKQYRETPHLLDQALVAVLKQAQDHSLQEYYGTVFKRYEFREKSRQFFEKYDLLLTPQTPIPAFDVGVDVPSQFHDRNICSWQYYTYPFNLTGQPAASVPAGFTADGLPVGLQIVAGINQESDIFRAAAALEASQPWAGYHPPGLD